ncbi:hypothetical protein HaLaN_02733 [Haematococcus lacustris]|uniref:Uncharacterized protein n=1 Tax=Haematococcus lacustris TaxID=44745 RepID=A0A699YIZ1_HAELA|nr:hypothetical protein HaLaN_02733 [Haematococcus lacustris]
MCTFVCAPCFEVYYRKYRTPRGGGQPSSLSADGLSGVSHLSTVPLKKRKSTARQKPLSSECESRLSKRRATRPADWDHPAGQVEQCLPHPAWSQQRDQPVRNIMWCPVVVPRKPPQAPCSSQAATQPAASEPGPSTPSPAKRSKRTELSLPSPTSKQGQPRQLCQPRARSTRLGLQAM